MQNYEIRVIETVAQTRIYVVRAESMEQATEMALDGETEFETTVDTIGVVDRTLLDTES